MSDFSRRGLPCDFSRRLMGLAAPPEKQIKRRGRDDPGPASLVRGSCLRAARGLRRAAVAAAAIKQDRADGQQARGEQLAGAELRRITGAAGGNDDGGAAA